MYERGVLPAVSLETYLTGNTDDVRAQLAQLEPRSVDEGWCAAPGVEPPLAEIPASFRVVRVDLS